MHLSPAAIDAAIRLLDGPAEAGHYDHHSGRGEILEAAGNPEAVDFRQSERLACQP